jgi:hypothetical protein
MATFVVAHEFKNYVGKKVIDMTTTTGDSFKLMLTNSTPTAAGTTVKADLTPISAAGGYAEKTLTHTWAETAGSSGVWRLSIGADQTWTASGAAFDTFRYVVLYDDTPNATPTDPVVGWWDAGTQNIADGSSFTLNVDADFAVFELN